MPLVALEDYPKPSLPPSRLLPISHTGRGFSILPRGEAPAGPHVLAFAAWVYADQDFLFEHKR